MEVAEVAWDQESHDLAAAIRKHLVAAGEAVEHEMDVAWGFSFVDQVFSRPDPARMTNDPFKPHAVFAGKIGSTFELGDQRIGHDPALSP